MLGLIYVTVLAILEVLTTYWNIPRPNVLLINSRQVVSDVMILTEI
jgi:hypothetical protein